MTSRAAWDRIPGGPGKDRTLLHGPRQQLPVSSPMSLGLVGTSLRVALAGGTDPRTRLEELLGRHLRANEVRLCASGTCALQVAIREALDRQGGRGPVALPAFTCFDVAAAAVGADARILLYDIDPATLSPDPASLLGALRRGAQVVVISHLFGLPVDWPVVQQLAGDHGAMVVEDAAQGQAAFLGRRPLGSLGSIGVLSFGRGKGWTGGRGGAVLFRDPGSTSVFADDVLPEPSFADEGKVLTTGLAHAIFGRPSLYWLPASVPGVGLGETIYHPPRPPAGMTRLAAALLLASRREAARAAALRRRAARVWRLEIRPRLAIRHVRPVEGSVPGYLRYPLLLSHGIHGIRDRREARKLGIQPSYPSSLLSLPAVRTRLIQPAGPFPGADELAARLVTLPTHDLLSAEEEQRIVRTIEAYDGWRGGVSTPPGSGLDRASPPRSPAPLSGRS